MWNGYKKEYIPTGHNLMFEGEIFKGKKMEKEKNMILAVMLYLKVNI